MSAPTVEMTIQVPRTLEQQLERFLQYLPEILERGLREVMAEQSGTFQDENAIIELLTSRPTPEQVLSLQPSPQLQARVSELLMRNKTVNLSPQEGAELERYLFLEHIVRLAKAHAYQQLAAHP